MKMEDIGALKAAVPESLAVSPEVFQQLGTITRLLHDTMQQLGVMPKLQTATEGIPDARSRLSYIATKTADAANKVLNFVGEVESSTARIDDHLTDIMMAQDFHDLTGQVVAKVVTLANDLEDSLVKLLVQVVPEGVREQVDPNVLNGPVVNPEGRTDVVSDQSEVDDLLASLGF